MTIICGYQYGNDVWLASDSRTTAGSLVIPCQTKKIIRVGEWLLGIAGPARFADWRPAKECADIHILRDSLIEFVKDNSKESAGEPGDVQHWDVEAIVAKRGELWVIAPDAGLWSPTGGFAAIGTGQMVAYGAAYVLLHAGACPEEVMAVSVGAAIKYCSDCGGEIQIESTL